MDDSDNNEAKRQRKETAEPGLRRTTRQAAAATNAKLQQAQQRKVETVSSGGHAKRGKQAEVESDHGEDDDGEEETTSGGSTDALDDQVENDVDSEEDSEGVESVEDSEGDDVELVEDEHVVEGPSASRAKRKREVAAVRPAKGRGADGAGARPPPTAPGRIRGRASPSDGGGQKGQQDAKQGKPTKRAAAASAKPQAAGKGRGQASGVGPSRPNEEELRAVFELLAGGRATVGKQQVQAAIDQFQLYELDEDAVANMFEYAAEVAVGNGSSSTGAGGNTKINFEAFRTLCASLYTSAPAAQPAAETAVTG